MKPSSLILQIERGEVDLERGIVRMAGGGEVALTPRERSALCMLVSGGGEVVSRDALHREVWELAPSVVSRAADTAMARIRAKIELDPRRPRHVITVRGEGYRFVPLVDATSGPQVVHAASQTRPVLAIHDTHLDLHLGVVRVSGREAPLTATECALLDELAKHAGEYVARVELRGVVWGRGGSDKALSHCVSRLRAKLEGLGDDARWLQAVRRRGLRIAPPGSLPARVALPGFVGRTSELEELARGLTRHAILSIVGPAGIGKTMLARRYAGSASREAPVFFVECAELRDGNGLAVAVAASLGVGARRQDPVAGVTAVLAIRSRLVLILDNFEQMDASGAAAVEAWSVAAPMLRILVTTRVQLDLPEEAVLRLGPLDAASAATLFVQRSHQVASGLDAEADSEAIAVLVRRLEGHPLAIQLAAARTGTFSPRQILERLDRSLDVLRDRSSPDGRHSSLERALSWTWGLLSAAEQQAWVQCTAFHTPFTMEDAEAVVDVDGVPVWEVVEALVHHSVLQPQLGTGEPRFRLPAALKLFAAARMDGRAGDKTADRHVAWLLDRFGTLEVRRQIPQDPNTAAVVSRYREDLLVACARVMRSGESDDAVRLLLGAAAVGPITASQADLHAPTEALLARPSLGSDARAALLCWQSRAFVETRRLRDALATATEAFELAVDSNARLARLAAERVALARSRLAMPDAVAWCERALAIEVEDEPFSGRHVHHMLGLAWNGNHERAPAERAIERAIAGFRYHDEQLHWSVAEINRGSILLNGGWLQQARVAFEQAIEQRSGWPGAHLHIPYGGLGAAYSQLGEHDRAEACLRESIRLALEAGLPAATAMARTHLGGTVHLERGEWEAARAQLTHAAGIYLQGDSADHRSAVLCKLALVNLAAGDVEGAAANLAEADPLKPTNRSMLRLAGYVTAGRVAWARGNYADAAAAHASGAQLVRELELRPQARLARLVRELGQDVAGQPGLAAQPARRG